MRETKRKSQWGEEAGNMENPIILITSSEDEEEQEVIAKKKKRSESEEVVTVRSLKEEYRMISDLTGFDNLRAMIEAETFMKRKKRRRKKKKINIEFQAQEKVTVDTAEVKEGKDESVETAEAVTTESVELPENDVPQKPVETEQADTIKTVETINTSGAGNGVNAAEMLDLLSPSEYDGASLDMNFCRDAGQTLRTEVTVGGKNRRSRRRRNNIRMLIAAMTVHGTNKEKQADTCNGVETMTTLETESAEMKDNIVLRQLLRKPRYFDPPDGSWIICSNCGEEDHAAANCTIQKRKKPCSLCGSFEHIWKHCIQGRNCFVCKERGHLAIDCPEKHQENNLSYNFCLKCGNSGHDMFSCTSDYSPDDLKEIKCYVCKSFGHLCCVDLPDMAPRQNICYNCGQSDHLGSVCMKSFGVSRYSESPGKCNKRRQGHFARTCTNKRAGDFSTSAQKLPNKMRNLMKPNSAPHGFNKAQQKENFHIQENVVMNASQSR